ncbi:MAG: hypothetical protein KME38_28785 [Spirirestis rafaelensis WJT71-NPBG6]|jgi:hypothetical protein|nr:hypothetical protein [Spirirestis rafaelensis WJT71-NPBG6]
MARNKEEKEELQKWVNSILLDLDSSEYYSLENLKGTHWKKIWKIYDRSKCPEDDWHNEVKLIILEAHGVDESDYNELEILNSYRVDRD